MLDAHKVAQRASNFQTFKTDVRHANHYATGALLSRNFAFVAEKQFFKLYFFPRYSLKLKQARLCKKTAFQALKKMLFPHCSFETQRSSALQQNNFSGSKTSFFPRYSLKLKQARLCKKTTFLALFFFPHCSFETQRNSALQKKTIFQAPKNCFLRTNPIKFIQAWLCKKKIRL